MNKKKREKLRIAMHHIKEAKSIVDYVLDDELDCVSNYPENLQGTDRFDEMERGVDNLQDALENLDDGLSRIQEVI